MATPAAVPTTLHLDVGTRERVQRLAEASHRTADALMREAVEEYVDRAETRRTLLQEAVAAWEHYESTGLHLTEAEADEWMDTLVSGGPAPLPKCHV